MLDAVALCGAIKSRQLSCVEVMDAYLDHIERLNPRVNAIVSLQDRADLLMQARARDAQLARGEYLGPMHGFPHAVKDLEATAGIRTTLGSPLFGDFIPQNDAIAVERLKRAGAIIIGKTNVPEFGLGSHTYNPVFGTTLNAYDQSKTAGGSSGGAAVGLALRMLALADGSDYAGSLRNPAAFNNVFGFRPSFGRVPSDSQNLFFPSMGVVGPMARNVGDLAMLLAIQSGYDARAPLSIREDPAAVTSPLVRDFNGARVGWLADFGGLPFERGILDLCVGALEVFEQLGCEVEEARPDLPIARVWNAFLKLRAFEVTSRYRQLYEDPTKRPQIKPEARWEIEQGLKLTTFDIADASAVRTEWYRSIGRLFERYDYLIAPSAQVFPFDASIRWPAEVNGAAMQTYHEWMQVVILVTMSGCPALAAPVGFSDRGLPMGMQIVAPNHCELACLQLAHAYDRATEWPRKRLPALLSSCAA